MCHYKDTGALSQWTHLKRPWCWERLKAGGEGYDRGWDGWMTSLTQWTWVWANSADGEEERSLMCCSPWSCKVLGITEQVNNNLSERKKVVERITKSRVVKNSRGFPGVSDGKKEICLQSWRPRFNLWVGWVPWRREWQPTLIFLPGEFQGQRSMVAGYSPWGHKELDRTEWLTHTHTHTQRVTM